MLEPDLQMKWSNMKILMNSEGATMKTLVMIVFIALICLGAISLTVGQPPATKDATASRPLPAAVCKAIETYIAKVDATRSVSEKVKREAKYDEAKSELASVLNQYDEASLLTIASSYVRYTETVATADPGKPGFDDDLDKRLKSRSALLERCANYTSTR
jgi:hypothetical protein